MQLLKCHFIQLRNLKYVCASRTLIGERHFCKEKPKKPDLYGTLGLTSSATQSDIKKAYYDLTFKFHPDRSGSSVDATKFREVKDAYEVLGNYSMRKRYDKGLPMPLSKSNAHSQKPIVEPKVQYQSFFDSRTRAPKFQSKPLHLSDTPDESLSKKDTRFEKINKEYEDTRGMLKFVMLLLFGIMLGFIYKRNN